MKTLIAASFAHSRTVLLALFLIIVTGVTVYRTIPTESEPDIQIPIIYVSMTHDGISPEDAERLLVRPMEHELQGIEGVKEMSAVANEGHASVTLEFEAGVDIDEALNDVREKVDIAKAELPDETDEPTVNEVNLALFPVLVVTMSGDVPERTLLRLARDLQDQIEALPNVLEVEIAGDRDEVLEVIIDPLLVKSYGLELESLLNIVGRNNQLVAAGALDSGQGRFSVKVPGVFETAEDILNLPLKVDGDKVVRFRDVASLRRTFKDPQGFAWVDGRPALALEVSKRIGSNIIKTIEEVKAVVAEERVRWPDNVEVGFTQDKSDDIRSMLLDLQNNVLSAILLVMIVVVAALGLRTAFLVGFAVPGSFLCGILVLGIAGLTVNIVVLFGLILAVGMLVDGAIVVTELADRKMSEGMHRREAYKLAAQRMAWPITASTATTLAAFLPLVFWPGTVGEFMKYLPITLLATLTASLAMALIFVPNLGALFGKAEAGNPQTMQALSAAEGGDLRSLPGLTGAYVRALYFLVGRPWRIWTVLFGAIAIAITVYVAYGTFGKGIEFFPDVEPEQAQIHVHSRGDFSVFERDGLVRQVADRVLVVDGIERLYTRSSVDFQGGGGDTDEDVIGILQIEFLPHDQRRPAAEILQEIRDNTRDLAGLRIETKEEESGPPVGKPIQVEISSRNPDAIEPVVDLVRAHFDQMEGLKDVSDTRPIPGIEWRIDVDREEAVRFGTDIISVGSTLQLVTNGVLIGTYRPDDAEDEIDIRARFPFDDRHLERFDRLVVNTERGAVPVTNFVDRYPSPKVGALRRIDGKRVLAVTTDVEDGILVDSKVREIRAWFATQDIPQDVQIAFKGEDEEQQEAQAFLSQAFGVALFMIAIILVTQFNSFYQAGLILSAIVFSTVGVLLGLMIMQQPFGIVMSGVGVIALAGIVVNNNIVLIDTYNELRKRGLEPMDAAIRTGAQRLRPVLLTTVTTILGLLPMVFKLNIDLFAPRIAAGGPSTDWWAQLASAVAGGLAFATLLTLILTPCLLIWGANNRAFVGRAAGWLKQRRVRDKDTGDALPAPAELGG
ncbi:MAG: efflux RND transporter permease subunit, partial [Pseudomonadota bacterium]